MPDTQNIKVKKETLRKIRIIAALTGERMMDVAERLASGELSRLKKGDTGKNGETDSHLCSV